MKQKKFRRILALLLALALVFGLLPGNAFGLRVSADEVAADASAGDAEEGSKEAKDKEVVKASESADAASNQSIVTVQEEELPGTLEGDPEPDPEQIQIGKVTGFSSTDLPMVSNFNYGFSEQIYTKDEIGDNAAFSAISFYVVKPMDNRTIEVYLADTAQDSIDANSLISTEDAVKVYEGNAPFGNTGWQKISFSETYYHNTALNLAVIVLNTTGSYTFGLSCAVFSGTSECAVHYYTDGSKMYPQRYLGSRLVKTGDAKNAIILDKENVETVNLTFVDGENRITTSVAADASVTMSYDMFLRDEEYISGWNTEEDGSGTSYTDERYTFTEDTILYAQWIDRPVVTLKGNAEGVDDQTFFINPRIRFTIPVDMWNRNGYVLTGYNRNADGSGDSFLFGKKMAITEDITLYAQWTVGNQIGTINPQESTPYYPSYGYYDYGYSEQIYTKDEIGDKNVLTGIAFYLTEAGVQQNIRVYLADTDLTTLSDGTIPTSEATLVYEGLAPFDQAGWAYLSLNHAFVRNPEKNLAVIVVNTTGSFSSQYMYYAVYDSVSSSCIYKNIDDGLVLPEDVFGEKSARKNVIYFTGEKKETKTITYRLNDGSEEEYMQSFALGLEGTLKKNTFEREGYVFLGWNTESDGTGNSYEDEANIIFDDDVTLYAQWLKLTTLTLKGNADGVDDHTMSCDPREASIIPANALQRENSVLLGYNTKADGSGTEYLFGQEITVQEDTELYAQWTAGKQIGTIDLQTITKSVPVYNSFDYGYSEQIYTADEIGDFNVLSGMAFYVLEGSKSQEIEIYLADTDLADVNRENYVLTENATLVYKGSHPFDTEGWAYIDFDKNFIRDPEKNLAVIVVNSSKDSSGGILISFASIPENNRNHVFRVSDDTKLLPEDGNPSRDGGVNVAYITGAVSEIKTVTFKANDETDAEYTQAVAVGVETKLDPNTFTREHYTFTGWNTEEEGTGTPYTDEAAVTLNDDVTLYAQWEEIPQYTLTLKSGVNGMDDVTFTREVGSEIELPETWEREGYALVGYNTKDDGSGTSYEPGTSFTVSEDTVLYAEWEYLMATLTLKSGVNGLDDVTITIEKGENTELPDDAWERDGYTLIGFNTKDDGSGTSYEVGTSFTLSEDTTLYAEWERNKVKLILKGNADGIEDVSYEIEPEEDFDFPDYSVERKGYIPDSYNTKADGSGTRYELFDTISISEETVLYVQWRFAPISDDFDSDPEERDWIFVDYDGDGENWFYNETPIIHGNPYDMGSICSESFDQETDEPLTPDNWAISPIVEIGENAKTPMLAVCARGYFPEDYTEEVFAVYAADADSVDVNNFNPDDWTCISGDDDITTSSYLVEYDFSLEQFKGKRVRIAIRHYNVTAMSMLVVDPVIFDVDTAVTYTPVEAVEPTEETDGNIACFLGSDGYHYGYDEETESYVYLTEKEWYLPKLVPYIDENGAEQLVSAWPLDGTEKKLTA